MVAKIITVAQQKGGAGKTTLAAHLAVAYTAMKKRVVAVDIDPQQSLSRWYELRQERMDGTAAGESQPRGHAAREIAALAKEILRAAR